MAILDEAKVVEIRRRFSYGAKAALAAEYGVCEGTIAAIGYRQIWKHVP